MLYEMFKQECIDELAERLSLSDEKAIQIIKTHEQTVKGCYEREMDAEDTIDLILGGH